MSDKIKKNIYTILLLGIMLGGAFLRLKSIGGPSLWYDELYTVRASNSSFAAVIPETLASRHPPFYYLALHFWGSLGSGDAWVRLLSAAAGLVTIGLVFAIGRDLFSRRVGLWGAAFAAFSPFLVWYSRDATDYSMAIATTMASIFFLLRAARGGGSANWVFYVIASIAALFTHYYNILFLLAEIPLFLLLQKDAGKLRRWLICEGVLGLTVVPWMVMLNQAKAYSQGSLPTISIPRFESVFDGIGTAPIMFIKGYAGLVGRGETALSLSSKQEIILAIGIVVATILTLAARGLTAAPYRRNLHALTVFSVLTIALPVFLHLSLGALIAGRYYAVAAPVFFLLIASLISLLPSKIAWLPGILVIIVMILFLNMQRHGYYQEDWRGIMNAIAINLETGDEIVCLPLHQCVTAHDYYLIPKNISIPIKGGVVTTDEPQAVYLVPSDFAWSGYRSKYPDINAINDIKELKQVLIKTLESTDKIWLVSGTGNLGNYPKPIAIEHALSSDWNLQQDWDFTPLSLKLYKRK